MNCPHPSEGLGGRGGCRPVLLGPEEKISSADTTYVVALQASMTVLS